MPRELSKRPTRVRQSLAESVYRKLRTAVLTCELQPGSEVSELDLANQLKVSKTPVREALARLASDGYVRAYPRRGYHILPLTLSDMNDILDVRLVVEMGAVELACQRITDAQLQELDDLANRTFEPGGDQEIVIGVNREFHILIGRATQSARLAQLLERYIDDLERYFYLGAKLRDIGTETMEDHKHIVKALKDRDAAAARAQILEHTERTRQGLLLGVSSSYSRIPLLV
jgi:DNA-binding GntR family transcriptional regulator